MTYAEECAGKFITSEITKDFPTDAQVSKTLSFHKQLLHTWKFFLFYNNACVELLELHFLILMCNFSTVPVSLYVRF